ncbi:uncharacterized protein NDAI_0E02320 [Naumovozyma dairenensis CBS 421]|uniref:non-specific serine/threonine protein kinase n=1 Tax=Naumovozyma dairenensis (strain ATCC 10597 / BCRC 20456 / CBS 421 / NBRC 0211 / NRRL Y-12639) TaxID=1071378 RepID=G0WBC9_NAUDC|nr:hypothetical protein NDAI_0E02320 [Naumovozyma dairenensis CBS 421]CCD25049.1 hypothetical protein NDAI_0E02320 [Naumovozyma dairenensis CBS 421]
MASVQHRHTYYGGGSSTFKVNADPSQMLTTNHENPTSITKFNDINSPNSTKYSNQQVSMRRKHIAFGPYIIGSTIGQGEFGKVKLGWSKNPPSSPPNNLGISKQVAIKLIKRDAISKDSSKELKIYREINALKHLSHPNIVKLEEVLQNSRYIGIVLEYASGGEFYRYIQRKKRLKETAACRLFAQLINGVHYIHSKGLVHRDLKLENLLLDKHENLVITDFGFVNEFYSHNELMKTSCGSPCYAAPELVISTKPYEARKADIWSCGIILYAMLAGYLPWDDDSGNPDGDDISRLYYYITKTPLKFPDYINPIPRDLLRKILVSDPRRRITMKQIEKHEWLKPHTAFLSITPEEWDTIMHPKSNTSFIRPVPLHSRNMNRPGSTCSMSSSGSKNGDKRDSLIIDSTLIQLPAPPHESQSHVITKPAPTSRTPDLRHSPVRKSHTRNNSAASIALQAAVENTRDYGSTNSSEIIPTNRTRSSSFTFERKSPLHLQRTNLMSRDNTIIETSPVIPKMRSTNNRYSLYNECDTLVELPSNMKTDKLFASNNDSAEFNRKKLNNIHSNMNSDNNSYITNQEKNYNKFPTRLNHRKPRPTSYHPSSTLSPISPTPIFIKKTETPLLSSSPVLLSPSTTTSPNHNHPVLHPVPHLAPVSSSPISKSSKVITNNNDSPTMLACRSFSMSKPSLHLQSASGNLIKSNVDQKSVTTMMHEQVDIPQVLRIEVDSSANIIKETSNAAKLEMDENVFIGTTPKIPPINIEPTNNTDLSPKNIDTNIELQKKEKKRFSFLSFYSMYNTSKSSLNSEDSKGGKLSKVASSKAQHSANHHANNNSRKLSMNKEVESQLTTKNVLRDTTNIQHNGALRSVSGKPVYPHPDRINTDGKNKNIRASIMISALNDRPSQTQVPKEQIRQPHEQSTARKVIDFFKRRSTRL